MKGLVAVALGGLCLVSAPPLNAEPQTYPAKPIRVIVPGPANEPRQGGPNQRRGSAGRTAGGSIWRTAPTFSSPWTPGLEQWFAHDASLKTIDRTKQGHWASWLSSSRIMGKRDG